jgi:hypothetical protein
MDLDDVVKAFIPKSKRKALKRRLKKEGLIELFLSLIRTAWQKISTGQKRQTIDSHPGPDKVRSEASKQDPLLDDLAQAHIYLGKIRAMAESAENESLERLRLEQLSERVTAWVEKLEVIVTRALARSDDSLLIAERKRVPKAVKRLEQQLAEAKDPELRRKLEQTLTNRRSQLVQLEQLANHRQMVELKVENTLAQLGIIYTQLHSSHYLRNRSRYERMAAEIADEVNSLDDYLVTLNELQRGVSFA